MLKENEQLKESNKELLDMLVKIADFSSAGNDYYADGRNLEG